MQGTNRDTKTEGKNIMKEQEQRIAIAEACGWHVSYDPPHYQGMHPVLHQADDTPVQLPDYLNDLNAMHEAICSSELHTNNGLAFSYLNLLTEIVGGKPDYQCMALIQATAAQRAEAFLKTLNLWKTS